MLLFYITDRAQFPGPEPHRRALLLDKIAEAARAGVDFIQLRERDLSARDLESLAREAVAAVRSAGVPPAVSGPSSAAPRLLINHRSDIALSVGADGVHLRSDDISPADARVCLARNVKRETRNVFVAVSCHTSADIALAESHGADFAVFAPVFEKKGAPGTGLKALREACSRTARPDPKVEGGIVHSMPVLALGGVTLENTRACLDAGAAGIAGIRLFQQNDVRGAVDRLREIYSAAIR